MSIQETDVLVETTVVQGFEALASEEVCQLFGLQRSLIEVQSGRLCFQLPLAKLHDWLQLRSVENLLVRVYRTRVECFNPNNDVALERLANLVDIIDWNEGLVAWKYFTMSDCNIESVKSGGLTEGDAGGPAGTNCPLSTESIPKFRATCYRNGNGHPFKSTEVACSFGGAFNDRFGWPVSMKEYDINVVININDNVVTVCVELTKETISKRNLRFFGPTSLKANIAYCMTRIAKPVAGDVICDPLCGGGSISLESAICWPGCMNLCGDNFHLAPDRTMDNLNALNDSSCSTSNLEADRSRNDTQSANYAVSDKVNVVPGSITSNSGDAKDANNLSKINAGLEDMPTNYQQRLIAHDRALSCHACPAKQRYISNVDVTRWDATNLPLRDASLDIVVTDLPFGKKSGSKYQNMSLYRDVLIELNRVVRSHMGRVVILSQDKKHMVKALHSCKGLWVQKKVYPINMGGLRSYVFLLSRPTREGCR